MLSETDKQVRAYLKEKPDVNLHCNNEMGYWLWAVVVEESDCFWLNSFKTRTIAASYCKRHGLKITHEINDKRK